MTVVLGSAKQSKLMAISVVPSFNYTTPKKDSVAGYTLIQTLDNAIDTVPHTKFNGQPTYVLAQTTQPTCQGDEAGIGGGVKSGTVGKEVKPTSASSTIFISGKQLVREGDSCTMNNGNTVGKYVSFDSPAAIEAFLRQEEENPVLFAGPVSSHGQSTPFTANRRLTIGEKAMVKEVFGDAINPKIVRIHNSKYLPGQPDNTVITPNGHLYYPANLFREDFSKASPADKHLFIHEMAHVWQRQNGTSVTWMGLQEQISKSTTFDPYSYTLSTEKKFGSYGLEQQASMIADYYAKLKGYNNIKVRDPMNPNLEEYKGKLVDFLNNPKDKSNQPRQANTGDTSNH